MDAEFVEFLDKKFQKVHEDLTAFRSKTDLRFDRLDERLTELADRVARLEAGVERLTTSIDRMTKLYEDVRDEQKFIIADLNRIKAVLKEKLGVEI